MTGYRFVLDTSAVLAYDGSTTAINVGELIAEAGTEYRMVGVPTLCLSEALRQAVKPEHHMHLRLLLGLDNVSLTPLHLPTVESCQDFANWIEDLHGRVDLAAAALTAMDRADAEDEPDSVYVVSAVPDAYDDGVPVIDVS